MTGHHRGRSFSDSLVLEDDEKGGVVVSGINYDSSASQGLKEGDEIVGATIHFDQLKKNEVMEILKLIEPYNDKVQVLTKQHLRASKSLGNLDHCSRALDEMLKDSYNKLFNAKVNKFLEKPNGQAREVGAESVNGELKAQGVRRLNKRSDLRDPSQRMSLPIVDACLQTADVRWSAPKMEVPTVSAKGLKSHDDTKDSTITLDIPEVSTSAELTPTEAGSDINSPGHVLGFIVPEYNGDIIAPTLNSKAIGPEIDLNASDLSPSGTLPKAPGLNISSGVKTPNLNLTSPNIEGLNNAPDPDTTDIDAPSVDLKVPKLALDHNGTVKAPEVALPKAVLNGSHPELKDPDLPVNMPTGKLQVTNLDSPELNINIDADSPKPGFSVPKIVRGVQVTNLDDPEFNLDIDADMPVPMIAGGGDNLTGPTINIKAPKLDIEETDTTVKMPNFKMPDLGLSSKDCDLKTPDLSVPNVTGEINPPDVGFTTPDLNIDMPKSKIKVPSRKKSKSRVIAPDLNVDAPSEYEYKPNLKGPELYVKSPDIAIGRVKPPLLNVDALSEYEYISDSLLQGTDLDINAGVKIPKLKKRIDTPDLEGPEFNVNPPKIVIGAPSGKLNMPECGSSAGIEGDIEGPGLSSAPPDVGAGINDPDIDMHLPTANLKGPKVDLNFPDIEIPTRKLKMPSLKAPDYGLSGPKVKGPDCEIKTPDLDLSASNIKGEINSPEFDLKGPKLKTPDMNIDVPSGKVKVPTLKKPKSDLKTPDFDIDAPSGKLKMPKFGLSGTLPKGPDLDINAPRLNLKAPKIKGGIDAPDLDMQLPKADLKGPELDVKSPGIEIDSPSGKFKMPKFKMPNVGLPGLKGSDLAVDGALKRPDLNLSTPKVGAGIGDPDIDINLPTANLKGPKTNLKLPDMDIDRPSGKFKMPTFKMADFGFSGPKVKGPDFDLKAPELDLSAPNIKGEINPPKLSSPKFGFKSPKLDRKAPNMNIDVPSGKVKVPKLKKPKINLKAPDFDIDAPSGKMKMPKFGLSGTLPKGPDLDINAPGLNLKAPKIKGGIDAPDIDMHLPKADLKGPELDVKSPGIEIDSPSGKFKMPKFKMPKFSLSGLKVPDFGVGGDLNGPDLNFSPPKVGGGIGDPDIDINLPTANLKGPKTDLNLPNIGIDRPSGKFKMPSFKLPDFGFSGPKVKGPDVDLKTPDLDLSAPDMNIDGPSGKVKVPTLKKPKINLKAPDFDIDAPSGKTKMPKFGLSGTLPKGPDLDISAPSLNLKAPKIKGGFDAPDLDMHLPTADLKGPELDVKSPDIDIDGPSGKLKMPKLKMPKFSLSGLKGPDFGVDGDLKGPDLNFSPPKVGGGIGDPDIDINLPTANLKGPKTDLNLPNMDINSPSGKFKMPSFKMPDFGFSGPKVNTPDLDLSAPNIKGEINPPKFGFRSPKLDRKTPNMNIDVPSGKVKVPTPKKPKVNLKAPDFDIDAPSGKMKIPKFGLSGTLPKGPDLDINAPSLNLIAPQIKGGIDAPDLDMRLPKADLKGPELDIKSPDIDVDAPSGKFKKPNLKMPKSGLPGLKGPQLGFEGPDLNLSPPRVGSDIDFGASMETPDMNLSNPQIKAGVSTLDLDGNVRGSNLNMKAPKIDIESPDLDIKVKEPRRSKKGASELNVKGPYLDIGTDVKTPNKGRPSRKTPGRSSYPAAIDLGLPSSDIIDSALGLKVPDLNLDDPTDRFQIPKSKNPNIEGAMMKAPDLDVDANLKVSVKKLPVPKSRRGTLAVSRSGMNLNIPDIKGSPKMKKAAAGDHDVKMGKSQKHPKTDIQTQNIDINSPKSKGHSLGRSFGSPNSGDRGDMLDGRVNQHNRRSEVLNGKAHTQRSLDLGVLGVDLEVPESTLKGSRFNLLKLI